MNYVVNQSERIHSNWRAIEVCSCVDSGVNESQLRKCMCIRRLVVNVGDITSRAKPCRRSHARNKNAHIIYRKHAICWAGNYR